MARRLDNLVSAWDEATGRTVPAPVTRVFHHAAEEMSGTYLVSDERLGVTPEHPVFVGGQWIPAAAIEIAEQRNFFADGVLVHNKGVLEVELDLGAGSGGP
jgi:hypothetical protein